MLTQDTKDAIKEAARYLDAQLGTPLLEFLTDSNKLLIPLWKTGEALPNSSEARRLLCAANALRRVAKAESEEDARAWFTGPNIELCIDHTWQDLSPCEAIRMNRFTAVWAASMRIVQASDRAKYGRIV